MNFRVVNWKKYQHYSKRNPPWIKVHRDLLEKEKKFHKLPETMQAHLMKIWVLASMMDNKIPYYSEWVATEIKATSPVDLDGMLAAGFIEKC